MVVIPDTDRHITQFVASVIGRAGGFHFVAPFGTVHILSIVDARKALPAIHIGGAILSEARLVNPPYTETDGAHVITVVPIRAVCTRAGDRAVIIGAITDAEEIVPARFLGIAILAKFGIR
jgi:hypothetical protein